MRVGAAHVGAAVLKVPTAEDPLPQTREHLQLANQVGIQLTELVVRKFILQMQTWRN
jgi:translation elongation factor EF-Tu-like GTPase